jgi:NAD+-dependent secondary alcohol dehydrogenase Adh1
VIVRVGRRASCRNSTSTSGDGQFVEAWKGAGIACRSYPAHETAGWVHEVGSAVTHIAVGGTAVLLATR